MKKIAYTLLLSLLCFGISNAQLRKDLEDSYSISGAIIDPTIPGIEDQLFSSSFDRLSFNRYLTLSISGAFTYSDPPLHFQYDAIPYNPPTYKYDCTKGYDCVIGLNKSDNFPQVIGKMGIQYLIESYLK